MNVTDASEELSDFALLSIESLEKAMGACETSATAYARNNGLSVRPREFREGCAARNTEDLLCFSLWVLEQMKQRILRVKQGVERDPLEFTHLWMQASHACTCLTIIGAMPYVQVDANRHGLTLQ